MPKEISKLPDPAFWIRQYLFNELKEYSLSDVGVIESQAINPIIPTSPTWSEDFYTLLQNETGTTNPLVIQYDKLMRFRVSPFYRIKKEQLILTVNNEDSDIVANVTTIIEQLLDREDAAAQDVNAWCSQNSNGLDKEHNVFFHKFRVFKVDESRDLVELNSVNLAFARTRLIVEFDYHWSDRPDPDGNLLNYK